MAAPSPARTVCRYLGIAGEAERHESYPTARHRCHLWSLREQVDVSHQRNYCLTEAHRRCPWLSVPPPGYKPADRSFPTRKVVAGGGGFVAALSMAFAIYTGGLPSLKDLSLDFRPSGVQAAAPAAATVNAAQS